MTPEQVASFLGATEENDEDDEENDASSLTCAKCGKTCGNKGSYVNHTRKCSAIVDDTLAPAPPILAPPVPAAPAAAPVAPPPALKWDALLKEANDADLDLMRLIIVNNANEQKIIWFNQRFAELQEEGQLSPYQISLKLAHEGKTIDFETRAADVKRTWEKARDDLRAAHATLAVAVAKANTALGGE